jgi:hypothetical protein
MLQADSPEELAKLAAEIAASLRGEEEPDAMSESTVPTPPVAAGNPALDDPFEDDLRAAMQAGNAATAFKLLRQRAEAQTK